MIAKNLTASTSLKVAGRLPALLFVNSTPAPCRFVSASRSHTLGAQAPRRLLRPSQESPATLISPTPRARATRAVFFNRVLSGVEQLDSFEQMSDIRLPDGRYWHDKLSGLWGREGAGPSGSIQPGLELGGALREDASHGKTGVFINCRQVRILELLALRQSAAFPLGRYWLDGFGNFGPESGPASGNLHLLRAQSHSKPVPANPIAEEPIFTASI